MQGAQILKNEAYLWVRHNDLPGWILQSRAAKLHSTGQGCSATQQMDFLRSHQILLQGNRCK